MEIPPHTQVINESGDDALETAVLEAVRRVYDPEIPINIFDLGLIYTLHIGADRRVFIRMTLTAPNCPAAGILPNQAQAAVGMVEGVEDVDLEVTFDPPFTPDMMSDEAKLTLGML